MRGGTSARAAEVVPAWRETEHRLIACGQMAAVAPSGDDQRRRRDQLAQPAVVGSADGVAFSDQGLWVGGAEGKKIADQQPSATPGASEAGHAADGGVVAQRVGSRRIQAHEGDPRPRGIPVANQSIAIAAAARDDRSARRGDEAAQARRRAWWHRHRRASMCRLAVTAKVYPCDSAGLTQRR